MEVQPPAPRARRIVVEASAQLPRKAPELIPHVAAEHVGAESPWDDHVAHLGHEPTIEDVREWERPIGDEVVERAKIVLALKGEAAILRAGIDRQLVVAEIPHRDALSKRAQVEWIDAVRQLDLGRDGRLVVRSPAEFPARAARETELRRNAGMVLEVAESVAWTELAGARLPAYASAVGQVAAVVRLHLPELAEIVVDGECVEEARRNLARHEGAGREAAAEELLDHQAIRSGPKRPRALHRSRGERRHDADTHHEEVRGDELDVAEDQRLLGRAERPTGDVVAKARIEEEAGEPDHRALPVERVLQIALAHLAEMIGEDLSGRPLIQ